MANALYDAAKESFITAGIAMNSETIRMMIVDGADYTPLLATHDFFDDVNATATAPIGNSGGNTRADGTALGTKTTAAGVFDAVDTTLTSVTGDICEYVLLFSDVSTDANSDVIVLFDTMTGLPVTPNGGDITVAWNGSGIFAL